MLLATRCPHCRTTFKVAHDQLKLQAGLVRCGVCHEVFNGVEQLTDGSDAFAAAPLPQGPTNPISTPDLAIPAAVAAVEHTVEPEPKSPAEFETSPADNHDGDMFASFHIDVEEPYVEDQTALEEEAMVANEVEWRLDADSPAMSEPTDAPAPIIDALMLDQHDVHATLPEDNPDAEPVALADLGFIRKAQVKRRMHWILSGATLLLLLLLAAQGIFQFRDLIAAAYPKTKPGLTTVCGLFHCQIRLPAQLDAISYEADELHTLARPGMFEFSFLMHNHSSLGQAWPNIELTMKDSHKQPVIRRVFTPSEYLRNVRDITTGFGANQEQQVKLYFVMQQAPVTDYGVALFYP